MRLTDENGKIVAVNDAYCKLVGLAEREIQNQPLTVVYANGQLPDNYLDIYCSEFKTRTIQKKGQGRIKFRNGQEVILEETNSLVEREGKTPLLLSLFRDVSAQTRLEEQLRQAQKMEAIGQLAGGVAHDFNNILTIIHGHAALLGAGGTLSASSTRSAHQIVHAAERAAALTRQLLAFSRRQVMQSRRLDLNEVVENVSKMLGRILGEDIVLHLTFYPAPAFVQADATMMEQVLMNLAVNSRDAMPRGGRLDIQVGTVEFGAEQLISNPERQLGNFVSLRIQDTGTGIPPEILPRIFEPFFTTKEVGKGTGLGLATVYGILKQHRGWIEVESQMGVGTQFTVYLPSSVEAQRESNKRQSESPAVRGGTETILVVEDEALLRELVCSLLGGHGYKILEAESGVKALNVWEAHRDKIDLVLTDLVMPDRLNGRELAEKLWAERPELKVIFTSGYSADVVGKDFVLRKGLRYLQKPYPPHKLAFIVRECLDVVN